MARNQKNCQARWKGRYRCCPQASHPGSVFLQDPGREHGLGGAAVGREIS